MDNSIFYLNELVKSLMSDIEVYQDALRMHAITIPREKLEEAVRYGFPEDIYSYYMNTYYVKNEAAAEGVINFIKKDFIPYLQNVSFHLREAMNVGPSGTAESAILTDSTSIIHGMQTSNQTDSLAYRTHKLMEKNNYSPKMNSTIPKPIVNTDYVERTHHLIEKNKAIEKNNKDLENALGITKGVPMSIAEADKQNANPHLTDEFIEDPSGDYETITGIRYRRNPAYNPNDKKYYEQFKINCATCATAYALRLRGFDVKAKGNEEGSGSLNEKIANANEYLNVWKNLDGTKAEAIHTDDWMKKNGIKEMTTNDYRNYFDETCKEKGVYVVMVRYSDDSSGHATILQRDSDGVLYYIEPQRYEMSKGTDGKRSLDDLLMRHDGSQNLSTKPSHGYGVLRVDDKLFNTDYADLFEI